MFDFAKLALNLLACDTINTRSIALTIFFERMYDTSSNDKQTTLSTQSHHLKGRMLNCHFVGKPS